MHCRVITETAKPEADIGVFYMRSEGYEDMCNGLFLMAAMLN